MRKTCVWLVVAGVLAVANPAEGDVTPFILLTHPDNKTFLPQPKGQVGVSGDHLVGTPDDVTAGTFNPAGCFSFTFMNPVGVWEPDYPPGYAEGIHSMTGAFTLEVDLQAGGPVAVTSLALDGFIAPGKTSAQRLIGPGDPAADGNHGPVDGLPGGGAYSASDAEDWAFDLVFDWFFDTPFGGPGTIDMTFDDYRWSGFIVPVGRLTPEGMALVTLDDPLGFFGGTSADFEAWLLNEVRPALPAEATWLLFAQGTAHPAWTHPQMGMTTDGLADQTIVAYTTVPEPASVVFLLAGAMGLLARRSGRKR